MATNVKIGQNAAWEIEGTPGTYQEANTRIPFTSFDLKQSFDLITDASIVGVAFPDLPVQGVRHVAGPVGGQVDVLTLAVLLEAVTGDASSPYTLQTTKNEKTLSIVYNDLVKTYQYAGVVVNSFELSSEAEGDLTFNTDMLGWKAESRGDSAFPTMNVESGTRLVHHHCGGTSGYARIADQADALSSGDNQYLSSVSCGVSWQFAEQFYNNQGTLQPLSGSGGRPESSFSFKIARHEADTYLGYRDARTPLQAAIYYYASATAALLIEIPNFIISDLTVTADDVPDIDVTATLGRNGIGTDYSNANMEFVSPIRFTLTNS